MTSTRSLAGEIALFLGALWDAFKGVPAVVGAAAGIIAFAIEGTDRISARWAALALLAQLALITALIEAAWKFFRARERGLPRLLQARRPNVGSEPVLVLLEPSELFSFGDMVSFYYTGEDQFEQLIGIGAVVNVQRDGSIQALLQAPAPEYSQLIDRLATNEDSVKSRISVKPNVRRAHAALPQPAADNAEDP